MKKTIFLLILIIATQLAYTQSVDDLKLHNQFIKQGDSLYEAKDFYKAYEHYRSAEYFARTNAQKAKAAKDLMDKAVAAIYKKMAESDSMVIEVNAEKEKAEKALAKAEEMQTKVETAMFDIAVKERNKEWMGYSFNYSNYGIQNNEILEKIDSLNLSSCALLRLPKEIAECPNLVHINLLDNPNIDWKDCFEKLISLKNLKSVYVSVYDLDSISKDYWNLITGISMTKKGLTEIPENIMEQTQLIYLDLSGDSDEKNNLTISPDICKLINLQYLKLLFCQIDSLPLELFNLISLKSLSLGINDLTSVPKEIGNLTNLNVLDMPQNKLTSLPKEIGNLNNLWGLGFYGNQLTQLPAEIGNLKNLQRVRLQYNQLETLPKELANLSNLSDILITGNPITYLPDELLAKFGVVFMEMCVGEKKYDLAKETRLRIMKQKDFIDFADLSWYCTFAYDFEGAILAGEKYIKDGGTEVGFISNLGLGYLWNGDYEKAKALYLKYKDTVNVDGRIGKEVFLKDISDVEAAGIIPKNQADVENIKKLLNE